MYKEKEVDELNKLPDYYKRLGISRSADKKDIENAFEGLVLQKIPRPGESTETLVELVEDFKNRDDVTEEEAEYLRKRKEAYEVLSNDEKRARHDEKLDRIKEIFQEQTKEKGFRFLALGGGKDIGASCYYVRVGSHNILFDAGAKQWGGNLDFPPFGLLENLPDPEAVFITHAHTDHIGALPRLLEFIPEGVPVFATKKTVKIAEKVMNDSIKVKKKEGRDIPYSEESVKETMRRVTPIKTNHSHSENGISFVTKSAGHIPGSVMYLVEADGEKIAYTGDYRVRETGDLKGAKPFDANPDLLITEGTYADREKGASREEMKEKLHDTITKTVQRGRRVLVGVYAIGRTRTLMNILNEAIEEERIPEVPIYTMGLGASLAEEWKWDNIEKFDGGWNDLKKEKNCVMVLGSGFFDKGTTAQLLPDFAKKEEDAIVLTGYAPGGSVAAHLEERTFRYLDRKVPVKCDVEKIHFSAHAGQDELLEFITKQSPKNLTVVHSTGPEELIKKLRGGERLNDLNQTIAWTLQVIEKGTHRGIKLKPSPIVEESGSTIKCESCGKLFTKFGPASRHAEREGHSLRGARKSLNFFGFDLLGDGEIAPGDVVGTVHGFKGNYIENVSAFALVSKMEDLDLKSFLAELKSEPKSEDMVKKIVDQPFGEDEIEAAKKRVGDWYKNKSEEERDVPKLLHTRIRNNEKISGRYKELTEKIKQNTSFEVDVDMAQNEFVLKGDINPGFRKYLEEKMGRVGNVPAKIKFRGEEQSSPENAPKVSLPEIIAGEIQEVEKFLGCDVRSPTYSWEILPANVNGKYFSSESKIKIRRKLGGEGRTEDIAVTVDHELAHHFQFVENKSIREYRENNGSGLKKSGELDVFMEGFAQFITKKLKNSRRLAEKSERAGPEYFEGAKKFEDIAYAYNDDKAIDIALNKSPEEFKEEAKKAKEKLASTEGVSNGFGILEKAGVWRRYWLIFKGFPKSERKKMLEIVREKAVQIQESEQYCDYEPRAVAKDASLEIVANWIDEKVDGGRHLAIDVKRALECKLMENKWKPLHEKLARAYIKTIREEEENNA